MMHSLRKQKTLQWTVCAIALLFLGALSSSNFREAAYVRLSMLFQYEEIQSPDDLVTLHLQQMYSYLPIVPPGVDEMVHPYGSSVVPFQSENFPKAFQMQLVGEWNESRTSPAYKLWLHIQKRHLVAYNADGLEAARFPLPRDYDPRWLIKKKYPNGFPVSFDEAMRNELRKSLNPSAIVTEVTLVPSKYLYAWLLEEEENAEILAQSQFSPLMAPMSMMSMMASTDPQMTIHPSSNDMAEVEVTWPTGFSDTLEIYAATELAPGNWEFAVTNITTSGNTNYIWQDSNTNQYKRFYVTGNADTDGDGDGLASARENYLYKTRSDLFDTDGDGLGDGWEMGYGFLPLSADGTNGALGDADNDGFGNLEEQLNQTDPNLANSSGDTGTVATIRYYYDEDDRLTGFFSSSEVAQQATLTDTHNIAEEVSAK